MRLYIFMVVALVVFVSILVWQTNILVTNLETQLQNVIWFYETNYNYYAHSENYFTHYREI